MPISDTGIWIDDESGEVVFEAPSRGTQIVAKGGEISGIARARLEREGFTDVLPGADDDKTVTTDDVEAKPARGTKSK